MTCKPESTHHMACDCREEAHAAEVERLRHALLTIERSGAPGGSICAKRSDGHVCNWCRGMWTPCPVNAASIALAAMERGP